MPHLHYDVLFLQEVKVLGSKLCVLMHHWHGEYVVTSYEEGKESLLLSSWLALDIIA